jgi:hypothetical protein
MLSVCAYNWLQDCLEPGILGAILGLIHEVPAIVDVLYCMSASISSDVRVTS